jgi:pimeloyl-ACP methyl ester carboxylesterase
MIHGMWGGPWCWDGWRARFEAAGLACIVPALPYHDADPRDPPDPRLGRTSVLDYADALAAQVRALEQPPIFVGHSMGGLLAQLLAARGLARALVLVAPAAPAGVLALSPAVLRSFWPILTRWGFWRLPVRPGLDQARYALLHRLPVAAQQAVHDRFVHESGRAVFEIGLWPLDRHHASRVDATQVRCPVLVLAGREDRITPVWALRRVARRYGAAATCIEFERHAHWLLAEPGWEAVADAALSWLRAQDGPGAAA